jgi:hypothetical protein
VCQTNLRHFTQISTAALSVNVGIHGIGESTDQIQHCRLISNRNAELPEFGNEVRSSGAERELR